MSEVIDNLVNAADEAETVMESAAVAIEGIAGRIDAAVQAAIANGATAEQLQPVSDESDQLRSSSARLQAAIANSEID